MTVVIISVSSVTSRNLTLTCNSFTDPPTSCFGYNLSSNCSPIGSICSVQSPPPTLRLLVTLLLICLVCALATTSPEALTYRLILFGSVTSPTVRLLATVFLIRAVHALAATSPAAQTINSPLGHILVGLVTSPYFATASNSFTDPPS